MAIARPQVTVFNALKPEEAIGTAQLPTVFSAPIRLDLVRFVHTQVSKNFRSPHGVKPYAGYDTSAESWGTGRAVARIPRVAGGGTHRAGQGAFGNMCRGGGMFSPIKTWRRWHRICGRKHRRHAIASAIAASAVPGLVMARGHKIDQIREIPIVVSDEVQDVKKTKTAKQILDRLGCAPDLERAKDSRTIRAGRGKMRNRRYVTKRGPLVVYSESNGIHASFKAIPGVDLCNVNCISFVKLAPGASLGRLVVWTRGALDKLETMYGSFSAGSSCYKGYTLPKAVMTNADLSRIINSYEIQSELNPAKEGAKKLLPKRNPLKCKKAMHRLNPAAQGLLRREKMKNEPGRKFHDSLLAVKKASLEEKKKYKALVRQERMDEDAAILQAVEDASPVAAPKIDEDE